MARLFAGGTDRIEFDSSLDIGSIGAPSFTLSAWVFPTGSAIRTMIGGSSTGGNSGVQFRLEADGKVSLVKAEVVNLATSSGSLSNSTWGHAAVSDDLTNVAIYLNGAADGSASSAHSYTIRAYGIGRNGVAAAGEEFFGDIAEVGVWDVVLTAGEIAALAKGFSPLLIRPASLVEYVPLVRNLVSFRLAAPTATGTTVSTHTRVILPRRRRGPVPIAATPPPETLFAQACL